MEDPIVVLKVVLKSEDYLIGPQESWILQKEKLIRDY